MEYTRLENLGAVDYMYPGEDNAFNQVRKIPLLDQLMGEIIAVQTNTSALPQTQANLYRVTERSCPKVYALFELAKARLDMHEEIPLFIQPDFDFNACAYGGASPFIIIHSSFIKNCSDEELLFVLGHELGHIKGNHAVYDRIVVELVNKLLTATGLGRFGVLTEGVTIALYDWMRKHEYSADRAGAIASGHPEHAIEAIQTLLGVHEKLKGVSVSTQDLLEQHGAYQEENKSIVSKLVMLSQIIKSSHPWAVDRIHELNQWMESGEFEALIQEKAVG
ncbi:MAG: M48 family metallopeptidase [Clostridia bacterium]|nr:M48 family metallopeptidase [Clostridia bacterium]